MEWPNGAKYEILKTSHLDCACRTNGFPTREYVFCFSEFLTD